MNELPKEKFIFILKYFRRRILNGTNISMNYTFISLIVYLVEILEEEKNKL
jgi:hypothetical protein